MKRIVNWGMHQLRNSTHAVLDDGYIILVCEYKLCMHKMHPIQNAMYSEEKTNVINTDSSLWSQNTFRT
jgi:hypothetical protein